MHHFDFIGDPNLIIKSYLSGFIFARKAGLSQNYINRLKIGDENSPWAQIIRNYETSGLTALDPEWVRSLGLIP